MEKPLLELTSRDSSFSVTVGRSSPAFIFGTRDLPDGQGGFESFIFDPQALTTNPRTGDVIVSDEYEYSYGGEDGRDLLSRSEPIPIGRTGFVRTDLTLTKEQEEGSDELVYTREFAISENFRRTTGDTDFASSLGPESLGSITPGRDISNGDRVHLKVWDKKLPVIVSGMTNGIHGWAVSVNSIARPGAQEITGHWKKKAPPAPKGSTGNHFDNGGGYSSGSGSYGGYDIDPHGFVPEDDYIPVADTYDDFNQDIETLSGERLLENVSKTDVGLLKTFRDGTEEEIEIQFGGGEFDGDPVIGMTKATGENGNIVVRYHSGKVEEIPASVDDLRIEGDELLVVKGVEVVKRLTLPSGSGGGGSTSDDAIITAIRRLSMDSHPTLGGTFSGTIGQRNGEATPRISVNFANDFTIELRGFSSLPSYRAEFIKAAPHSLLALIRARRGSGKVKPTQDDDAFFMVPFRKVLVSDTDAYYTPQWNTPTELAPASWWSLGGNAYIAPHNLNSEGGEQSPKRLRILGEDGYGWNGYLDISLIPTSIYPYDHWQDGYQNPRDFLSAVAPHLFPPQ